MSIDRNFLLVLAVIAGLAIVLVLIAKYEGRRLDRARAAPPVHERSGTPGAMTERAL